MCTYPSSYYGDEKSNSVFDDKVGCLHCSYTIFAGGAEAERSEEQCFGKGVLFQRGVHVQGLGLPLPGSLQ